MSCTHKLKDTLLAQIKRQKKAKLTFVNSEKNKSILVKGTIKKEEQPNININATNNAKQLIKQKKQVIQLFSSSTDKFL